MRKELRFVRGHVNVRRTVGGAALAAKAKVEGLTNFLTSPLLGKYLALQHFAKEARSPSSRVTFVTGHSIRRAHNVDVAASAPTNANASIERVL
jgi:hypothetical protein